MIRSADRRPGPALLLVAFLAATAARAHDGPVETAPPDERDRWIATGAQVHGGFGSFIALGIRIGHDAMRQLQANPRELDVTFLSGRTAPCPCIVDGIMVAVSASPGQQTLRVAAETAPEGELARIVFRHRKDGRILTYAVPASAVPVLAEANRASIAERWQRVMDAPEPSLFTRLSP